MRIAAIGRSGLLLQSIARIVQEGHQVVFIATAREADVYDVTAKDFERMAQKIGAEYYYGADINQAQITERIKKIKADIAISLNWVNIIGNDLIGCFPLGILNAHAGDLPRYRGNACANWAIIENEDKVVCTIHFMEGGILDSGPIVLQREIRLTKETTITDVYDFFKQNIPDMFCKAVSGLSDGQIIPRNQSPNPGDALRCYPRLPQDSYIDWRQNAEQIVRLVRASCRPFAGAYTYLAGQKLLIWRAYAAEHSCPSLTMPGQILWRDNQNSEVAVAAGDSVLMLQEIEWKGILTDKPAVIIRSNRLRMGVMVEDDLFELQERVKRLENIILSKK